MYGILRFFLFLLPPEKAHYLAMDLLFIGLKLPVIKNIIKWQYCSKDQHAVVFLGIRFPNPIGLAAGFDKDARWLHLLKNLGFGFVEVGTVTPLPQDGNPKPRLFRLKKDLALINRMGFNNQGIDAMVERLKNRPDGLIVGGNIGKNKVTPNEKAIDDYRICFEKIYPWVDYIVVNVSSPNTPGLRELQEKAFLTNLFHELHNLRKSFENPKPILLKIAPDLTPEALQEIADTVRDCTIDGIIATNTTISREGLVCDTNTLDKIGAGGLSGVPVRQKSNDIIKQLRELLGQDYPIMGVGGIFTAKDIEEKKAAGANLYQVYTGFIYQGPGMVKELLTAF
ncbi:MAG: quinone-dependent dihydroorotate dehydrogenase [Bacteroidetes bacterium]|nr:quinone-dependent dihydroorotate dehydrogenase [Bacteroidota bacterium]